MSSDLLTLTQWLSPAFPLGAFAYSHGLEAAIAGDEVCDGPSLSRWIATVITRGTGRSDAILLHHALLKDADYMALSDLARALCASAERRRETDEQGAAFTRTVNDLNDRDDPAAPLPVALGRAAARLDVSPIQVAALYLQAFAGNLVTIGVRHIPLGQTEGQKILADLNPLVAQVARDTEGLPLDGIGNSALGADLAALLHETQDVRIFKT